MMAEKLNVDRNTVTKT